MSNLSKMAKAVHLSHLHIHNCLSTLTSQVGQHSFTLDTFPGLDTLPRWPSKVATRDYLGHLSPWTPGLP
jgi:hypothetical protein